LTIVPTAGDLDQVRAGTEPPEAVTVNCWVLPAVSETVAGVMVKVTGVVGSRVTVADLVMEGFAVEVAVTVTV